MTNAKCRGAGTDLYFTEGPPAGLWPVDLPSFRISEAEYLRGFRQKPPISSVSEKRSNNKSTGRLPRRSHSQPVTSTFQPQSFPLRIDAASGSVDSQRKTEMLATVCPDLPVTRCPGTHASGAFSPKAISTVAWGFSTPGPMAAPRLPRISPTFCRRRRQNVGASIAFRSAVSAYGSPPLAANRTRKQYMDMGWNVVPRVMTPGYGHNRLWRIRADPFGSLTPKAFLGDDGEHRLRPLRSHVLVVQEAKRRAEQENGDESPYSIGR